MERELERCSRKKVMNDPVCCKNVHRMKVCMHVNKITTQHIACTVTYHVQTEQSAHNACTHIHSLCMIQVHIHSTHITIYLCFWCKNNASIQNQSTLIDGVGMDRKREWWKCIQDTLFQVGVCGRMAT